MSVFFHCVATQQLNVFLLHGSWWEVGLTLHVEGEMWAWGQSWDFSPEGKRQRFGLCLETNCRAGGREEGLAGPCDGAARVCPKESQP